MGPQKQINITYIGLFAMGTLEGKCHNWVNSNYYVDSQLQ